MIKSRFFWKLFLSYALIIVVTVASVGVLVLGEFRRDLVERLELSLRNQCVSLESLLPGRSTVEDASERAQRIASETERRITLIDADGVVLFDSGATADEMANHGDRPEVLEAIASGVGVDRRTSATLGKEHLYVAYAPGASGPGSGGVVRVSVELKSLDSEDAAVGRLILISAGLASLLALLVGAFVVRRVTRPLEEMSRVTRAMSGGDYSARVALASPVTAGDALGAMGTALNQLGAQMSRRVTALTAGEGRLRAMVAGMIEGVVAVDENDHVTFSNFAARELLRIEGHAISGSEEDRRHQRLQDMAQAPELDALLLAARQSDAAAQCEIELSSTDEDAVVRAQAHRFQDGESMGVVIVLHDISEIRRLERVRRDFVANVSHELKTPLTSIRGFVETLLDGAIDDEEHNVRFLEKIENNVHRLNHLVTDLLSLARIEAETGILTLRSVDLQGIVSEGLKRHQETANGREQVLAFEPSEEAVRVLADLEALTQVIDNLVDNALKYTPDGGKVICRVRRENEDAVFEVVDDGVGIPLEDQARVFERFYRVDKARSRAVGGTGLGLSIVKHLVQTMKGTIELTSEPGEGSTFHVRLKLSDR